MLKGSVKVLSLAFAACLAAGVASFAYAQDSQKPGVVSNIKILSDKCEDITTMEDWKKTYIKDGMSDQDKAIAIWKTVTKYRHQDNPPGEGRIREGTATCMNRSRRSTFTATACAAAPRPTSRALPDTSACPPAAASSTTTACRRFGTTIPGTCLTPR